MLLSAMSVLVVAQSSLEIPEGLMITQYLVTGALSEQERTLHVLHTDSLATDRIVLIKSLQVRATANLQTTCYNKIQDEFNDSYFSLNYFICVTATTDKINTCEKRKLASLCLSVLPPVLKDFHQN